MYIYTYIYVYIYIYIYISHHYEQTAGRSMNIKIILVGVSGLRQK